MNLKQGTQLQGGRYRIEKVLGQGGFGITYLAEQKAPCRKVAIKEFYMADFCERNDDTSHVTLGTSGSREMVKRYLDKFLKEAQNISELEHRNIVSIIDVFEENGTAYYVMKYCSGGSLADRLKDGPMKEADAMYYIRQVADALDFIHSRNIMHLDVKPANILINEQGEAVLIDFGISKHYGRDDRATTSTPVGISHGYAPLEQYSKSGVSTFSAATDIYSLGATLYKLLTGVTPPEASEVNDSGLPALPSGLSSSVCSAIRAAMQPRRVDRPQSIKEFLALLAVSRSVTPLSVDAETKITVEEATVIESPVAEPLHVEPQPVALTAEKDANVKWIDFAQFCDYNGHSLKRMKAVSYMKPAAYVVWSITLLFLTIYAICEMDGGSKCYKPLWDEIGVVKYYRWEEPRWDYNEDTGKMEILYSWFWYNCDEPGPVTWVFIGLSVLLLPVLIPIVKGERLSTLNLIDIQDTPLPLKMIRNNKGLLGFSLWNKKKSRTLLGMKYDNISRINEDTFVCTRNGLSGVYNAAKRKMVVPVKCESIEVKNNRIHATRDGVLTVYTDRGYRVVE
ncbi:MAG: serine/threonine protein kinase [Bacteroidaceae bacterium]|nr:serine/threonine protein kinase [Bacteroidaceae bacterium]